MTHKIDFAVRSKQPWRLLVLQALPSCSELETARWAFGKHCSRRVGEASSGGTGLSHLQWRLVKQTVRGGRRFDAFAIRGWGLDAQGNEAHLLGDLERDRVTGHVLEFRLIVEGEGRDLSGVCSAWRSKNK